MSHRENVSVMIGRGMIHLLLENKTLSPAANNNSKLIYSRQGHEKEYGMLLVGYGYDYD